MCRVGARTIGHIVGDIACKLPGGGCCGSRIAGSAGCGAFGAHGGVGLWSVDWAPVVAAVDAVLAEASPSHVLGERALAVFEEGVVAQLVQV